jgi:TolB-like protein/class 3 adenylate cyclase/tetratricopeptide (TPR) repeat protein
VEIVTTEPIARRLAAILAADVAGYSRLMGVDEVRTVRGLKGHQEVILPMIQEFGGRIIDTAGDGILAEFSSVVNAVRSAVAIQSKIAERNAAIESEQRIQFRIGINIGDVIYDDARIYGDGINIAARLEGIAEAGGICVSGAVQEQVQGKLDFVFEDVGEQQLKNIARSVRVYRLVLGQSQVPIQKDVPPLAAPPLSMVVLPFANLSGDSGQDYFVDGMVEALTTDLSRIRESFVIARNTAFTYKNRAVDVRQIGQELGVRYLIQGSIQCAGTRLRVTVQLIHALTGSHLWAERFDHDRGDIFEMQDEIVTHLARMLDVELVSAESKRAALSQDVHSLDLTFQGWAAMNRGLNPDSLREARLFFEQALVLTQSNVMALAGLADANSTMVVAYMTDDRAACLAAAESMAMRALSLAPNEAKAHASLALAYMSSKRVSEAISEYERALALDHNLAFAHANIGIAKYLGGQAEQTEAHISRAIRLSPRDTWLNAWCVAAGVAKLSLCSDEEAVVWVRRAIEANRTLPLAHFFLASALAWQDKTDEAIAATKAGLALDPGFTIRRYRDNPLSDNPTYLAQRKRIYEGMFAAGVPEH